MKKIPSKNTAHRYLNNDEVLILSNYFEDLAINATMDPAKFAIPFYTMQIIIVAKVDSLKKGFDISKFSKRR